MAGESLAVEDVVDAYYGAPDEFVALLGSSGCGKTTLLRSISGFIRVRSGRIRVSDRDITQLPPEKCDMAMVFQSYALWPHMSAARNIAYGLRLLVPSVGFMQFIERFLKADVLAKVGS
jgi:ABC-type Fe3+/spermidine/putrescine transport system ATPase subunit